MYRELINLIPFNLLIIVLMGSFALITYLFSLFASYWFFDENEEKHIQLYTHFTGILTGGFFILLAFIIITTWSFQQEARNAISKETGCLAIILKDIRVFPKKNQEQITKAVGDYVVRVRGHEWERMRDGFESTRAWNNLEQIYASIYEIQPQTSKETIYYESLVANVNCVLQSRQTRLSKIESSIPPQLRDSVVVCSFLFAILLGIVRGKDSFINLIPMLLFSALLGFNLAIALELDYPYSGDITVKNTLFYQGSLGQFSDD